MVEQIAPYVGGDFRPGQIAGHFLYVLEDTAPQAYQQNSHEKGSELLDLSVQDHVVHDQTGELRGEHIQRHTDDQRKKGHQIGKFVFPDVSRYLFHNLFPLFCNGAAFPLPVRGPHAARQQTTICGPAIE